MKIIGIICIFISALTILYCHSYMQYNDDQSENDTCPTFFDEEKNITKNRYDFKPPLTGFEISIYTIGCIGIILTVLYPKNIE